MLRKIVLGTFILGVALSVHAAPDLAKIKAQMEAKMPGVKFDSLETTPIPGLYEAILNGQLIYLTEDARYMVHGDIYDRQSAVNLTEKAKGKLRLQLIKNIDDSNTVVFGPKKAAHTLNVFTDTSCGFCRKLHDEVPELNKEGIKVRYLMFPRAGMNSASYKQLESVWCADNQQDAMNKAKSGQSVPEKSCANPIAEHMELAQSLGLQGTPFIVTNTGELINGYRPAKDLIQMLNQ